MVGPELAHCPASSRSDAALDVDLGRNYALSNATASSRRGLGWSVGPPLATLSGRLPVAAEADGAVWAHTMPVPSARGM